MKIRIGGLDEAMKQSLLQELNRTACSEKKLIMLYFQRYLNLAQSDQLEQLTLHPGLKLDDYDLIQQEFHNTSISQLKATGIATSCELLFYHILLRKRRMFYDYFNGGQIQAIQEIVWLHIIVLYQCCDVQISIYQIAAS
ncbi:hypothetical protein pb186bvf_012322 [Paramecium bursaria]